jgi:hypothetical protein
MIPLPRPWCGALLVVLAALLAGCALEPVRPWQKEQLAHPEMSFEPDRLDTRYTDHIHFSREASSGGAGIGGGGCGCN